MAERIAALTVGDRLAVGSAGTHAWVGDPIHPGAAAALREVGADPGAFASRPLTAALVAQADLVLTAGRAERAASVTLCPPALRRVFTLRQFGRLSAAADPDRLVGAGPAERLAAMRVEVARVRGQVQPAAADEDDLADPFNGTQDDMRACVERIRASLAPWLPLI